MLTFTERVNRSRQAIWASVHRGHVNAYRREYDKRNPELRKNNRKLRTARLRKRCLEHYGGECACCGETIFEFLTFDHKSGRNDEKIRGTRLISWIRKNHYPDDIQILCWNCNCCFGHYGYCPHHPKKKRAVVSRWNKPPC